MSEDEKRPTIKRLYEVQQLPCAFCRRTPFSPPVPFYVSDKWGFYLCDVHLIEMTSDKSNRLN